MNRIRNIDDVAAGLHQLLDIDPRLKPVALESGPLPLRLHDPGFPALARIIISQLVSQASADAIHSRFMKLVPSQTPQHWLATTDETVREIGLTRAKQQTLDDVAQEIVAGALDLEHLETLPAPQAIAELQRFKGIGRWTAEIYLISCCGHPDIFPAGDLALRNAVGQALRLDEGLTEKKTRTIAAR